MSQINKVNVTPISSDGNVATPPDHLDSVLSPNYQNNTHYNFFIADDLGMQSTLGGDFKVITDEDGWYSNRKSDSEGIFSPALTISLALESPIELWGLRLVGDAYAPIIPVDYTITLTDSDGGQITGSLTGGTEVVQELKFVSLRTSIVEITLSITKINIPNAFAHIINFYPIYMPSRGDLLRIRLTEKSYVADLNRPERYDELKFSIPEHSMQTVYLHRADTLQVGDILTTANSKITNAHSLLKAPTRQIFGRVYITYFNPMLEGLLTYDSSGKAHPGTYDQLMDVSIGDGTPNYFTLYDNNLSGNYIVSGPDTEYGWVSSNLCGSDKNFSDPTWLEVSFSSRLLSDCSITFDRNKGTYPTRFDIYVYQENVTDPIIINVLNWEGFVYDFQNDYADVVKLKIQFFTMNKANFPACVMEILISSRVLYTDEKDLIGIDFLEELTFNDSIATLGSISANEATIHLDNYNKDFYYNNPNSLIRNQLRKNRRIEPFLGISVTPGIIEWQPLGIFWSDQWDVPVEELTASVTGYDTLYVLDKLSYYDHQVYINNTLGQLLERVLQDAKNQFNWVSWYIADELYDLVIPYAWFTNSSHAQALKRLASCTLCYIYCDRKGVIQCQPRETMTLNVNTWGDLSYFTWGELGKKTWGDLATIALNDYDDVWGDTTNVINKKYPSMYTLLANRINVEVTDISITSATELLNDQTITTLITGEIQEYTFNTPYIANAVVTIICDSSITYTYQIYSWGIRVTYVGAGTITQVRVVGDTIVTTRRTVKSASDNKRIQQDGLLQTTVSHDFIQSGNQAQTLANNILHITSDDNFYVELSYLGDIVMTLKDVIKLDGGISPNSRYILSRNKLTYDGALIGEATLIT